MSSDELSRLGTGSPTVVGDADPDSLVTRRPTRKASRSRMMKARPPARLMSRERSIEKAASSFRPLDLQEAAQREAGAGGSDEQGHTDQDHGHEREGKGCNAVTRLEPREDRGQRDLLREQEEEHSHECAGQAAQEALEHEGPAHEPVGGADELHDL